MSPSTTTWVSHSAIIFCLVVLTVESSLTVPEVIKKRGYPCEDHYITTKDGYILRLFRIPVGHRNLRIRTIPVIMQHGLLSSAFSWVLSTPHKSPAFLLADAGYDVWLPNLRGNIYSKNHTHYSTDSCAFWNFSWDEMAEFDFPAIVNYVLETTGSSQLYYIGHSMGTTIYFSGMNYHPELNEKIKSMFALAPVAKVSHVRSGLRILAYIVDLIKDGMVLTGQYEVKPVDNPAMSLIRLACKKYKAVESGCYNLLFYITGFDRKQFDEEWLSLVADELLSGTSINTLIQFGQEYRSGSFRRFDHGYFGNCKKYGMHRPPDYNLKNISSRVNLMWSLNDYLAGPKDVQYLVRNMPNVGSISGEVEDPKFNHIDFLSAPLAKEIIYDRIIEDMKAN